MIVKDFRKLAHQLNPRAQAKDKKVIHNFKLHNHPKNTKDKIL